MMKVNSITVDFANGPCVVIRTNALAALGVHINNDTYNKVEFIKGLRARFGLGLLEAKVLAEAIEGFALRCAPISRSLDDIVADMEGM